MADLVLPPLLRQARIKFSYIDNTGLTRGEFSGLPLTTALGGDRVSASVEFTLHGGKTSAEQSLLGSLRSFVFAMKGKQNRVYLTPDSHSRRGSFPATELFTNADFSNVTNGWTVSHASMAVSDGELRLTSDGTGQTELTQSVGGTQYVPYVLRSLTRRGKITGTASSLVKIQQNDGVTNVNTGSAESSVYQVVSGVVYSASSMTRYALYVTSLGGLAVGDYADLLFTSNSRCLVVDGGGNRLLHSDTITNAAWTKSAATASAVAGTAPDQGADAEALIENGATSAHFVSQSGTRTSAIADVCTWGFFKRRTGTRDIRLVAGNTALNYSHCIFDLAAGSKGSVSNVGTATHGRAFMVDAGNGWYFCCVVSRAEAATTIYAELDLVSAGNVSYTGDSSSSVYMWRCGAEVSSFPTRGAVTTSAAVAAASQPGSAIYVKGGRAPGEAALTGAVLAGDWLEIDRQLVMATEPLDLDAAGNGYLQFSPPLMRDVADNTPIIVHRPMGRFLYAGDNPSFDIEPGPFGKASLEFEAAPPTT